MVGYTYTYSLIMVMKASDTSSGGEVERVLNVFTSRAWDSH
jgi:hypothetical protein